MELGIIGHQTRGAEVIQILELLGGNNHYNLAGNYNRYFYYISDKYKDISNSHIGPDEIKGYDLYSIEDFLEKFPYKVGDKVNVWVNYEHFSGPRAELEEAEIKSMRWNSARSEIVYRLKDINKEFYKDEIKGKVNDNSNKQSECEQCGRVFGSVHCFDVDCPNNTPDYSVKLKGDKVNDEGSQVDQINTTSTHCNEEYVIEYRSSYSTKPHILTFNSFQDMETELNNLREYNKLHQIYSDIKCKKITTETLNI